MTIDFKKVLEQVKATGEDMTKVQAFADSEPHPEGTHRARFVGYIELGKQNAKYQGKPKVENQCVCLFELSGPRIKPRDDGQPHLIKIGPMNKSLSEKAGFFKLFQRLNYAGTATHIAELLGGAYLIGLYHEKKKGADQKERIYVNARKKGEPFDLRPPRVEDVDTGEFKVVTVDAAKTATKMFLWDYADMAQWASLFIEGEYEERKNEAGDVVKKAQSKNVWQNTIKLANNFSGSVIHGLLAAAGANLDIPDAESGIEQDGDGDDTPAATPGSAPVTTPTGAAADDALAGIV